MEFDEWLATPAGRHCVAVLSACGAGIEAGAPLLELAFVAGRIAQAKEDRLLVRCAPGLRENRY